MIKKQLFLSFILIIILILIINFNSVDKFTIFETNFDREKQKYVGPIIFLQRNNNNVSKINCLNQDSQFECIGKYPKEALYPTESELQYVSEPNIIKIPRGNVGTKGELGRGGLNKMTTWDPISNINKIVSSEKYNRTLNLTSSNIYFNSPKNTIKEFNKLCIIKDNPMDDDDDYCIDRSKVIDVADSFVTYT